MLHQPVLFQLCQSHLLLSDQIFLVKLATSTQLFFSLKSHQPARPLLPFNRLPLIQSEAERPAAERSRGDLVTDWLSSDAPWDHWRASHDPKAFGGFNLVVGDLRQGAWAWLSNRNPTCVHQDPDPQWHCQALSPGLYGLSNASLNVTWPKTRILMNAVQDHPAQADSDWPAEVLRALADQSLAAHLNDSELPNTGLSLATERALANPFVRWPERHYGTRSSTLLALHAIHGSWQLRMSEWTHPTQAPPFTTSPRLDHTMKWGQIPNA
jgi:uncharacterized protein with NRDE domain